MAARYVDTANIVAQGQSFYTGLLPGSYEKGGGGGGSNVMGKGSGGSAGVSADRTGSTAAQQSITGYPTGGSILGKQQDDNPTININLGGEDGEGGLPMPVKGPQGDDDGSGGVAPTDTSDLDLSHMYGAGLWTGGKGDIFSDDGKKARTPEEEAKRQEGLAKGKVKRDENKRLIEVGKEAEGDKQGSGLGAWMKSSDAVEGMTRITASKSSGSAPPLPDPGGIVEKAIMGQWNGSVQRRASTRSQTRQSGVQQSATHKSFLYPNMANSTNRALNF